MPPLKDERRYRRRRYRRRCLLSVLRAPLGQPHLLNDSVHFPHIFTVSFSLFSHNSSLFRRAGHGRSGREITKVASGITQQSTGGRGKKNQSAISEQDSEAWTRECCGSQSNRTSRIDRDQEMERACWQLIGRRASGRSLPAADKLSGIKRRESKAVVP